MQDVASKWGLDVAKRGFAQIPNYLIQLNLYVHDDHKLAPAEMIVLLQLVATWWKKDEMPFPSMSTIADRSWISERQVQRAIKSLEQKGYVTKTKRKIKNVIASNVYDLTPTVGILQTIAGHFINEHPRNIKTPDDMPQQQEAEPHPGNRKKRRKKRQRRAEHAAALAVP